MNNKPEKIRKSFFKKVKYYSIFTIIMLIIAEIILSLTNLNSEFTWEIDYNEITGIQQDSKVSFDELGARSISNYENAAHKIIVFGGSTTACFALTQEKTWSALLEKKLGDSYWVGNFGRPGNMEKPELNNTKTVVIMQGVNDFVAYLISSERYLNSPEQKLKKFSFQHIPDDHLPFYKQLNLYKLASRAKRNISFYFTHSDHLTKAVVNIKELRKQSKIIEELPDLKAGLAHYEANIKNLIQQAKEKKVKLVFVTQATMWKPNLEQKYDDLMLTSGFANNEAFYSTEALYTGMEVFNERLMKVCDQNNISYLDLKLPKTTESFYDDFHFNESGAELTSDQLSTFLKTILK